MKKTILKIALAFAFAIPFAGSADAYGERWYMGKTNMDVVPQPDGRTALCRVGKGQRFERLNNQLVLREWINVRLVGRPFLFWCTGWIRRSQIYNMDTVIDNLNYYSNLGDTVPVWQNSWSIWASRDKARAAPPLPKEIQHIVKYDRTLVRDGPGTTCIVSKGTKVRMEKKHETFGQVFADVTVLTGPHKGCYGYVRFQRIEPLPRNAQWILRAPKVCDIEVGTKVHVFQDHFNGSAKIKVIDGPCRNREGWILSYTLDRNKTAR